MQEKQQEPESPSLKGEIHHTPGDYLFHKHNQGLAVVLPLLGQLGGVREFVTGQLHRDLEAVGVQVAEVVHAFTF